MHKRENNIYDKITHWFEVIKQVLHNMNETGAMLCKLGSVKALVDKDDLQDYRDASIKQTIIASTCI